MAKDEDDEMKLISVIAKETGIPAATLRYWALHGELAQAERRDTMVGKAWFTTKRAALERNKNRGVGGRPRKS